MSLLLSLARLAPGPASPPLQPVAPAAGAARPAGPIRPTVVSPLAAALAGMPADQRLPAGFVTAAVSALDGASDHARLETDGEVHVSSLVGGCARRHVLLTREDGPRPVPTGTADRVARAMGRAAERHVVGQFIAAVGRGAVFGAWSCPCGGLVHSGFYPAGDPRCGRCGKAPDSYREIVLRDHGLRVRGNPDLLFRHARRMVVVEIKSMAKDRFDALREPLPAHLAQAGCYHRLLEARPLDAYPLMVLVYVRKDYDRWRPAYKEFHVDPSAEPAAALVADAWREARAIREAAETGRLPPRLRCRAHDAPMAKECPMVGRCFSLPA